MKKIRKSVIVGALALGIGLGVSPVVFAMRMGGGDTCYSECMSSWGSIWFCTAYCGM